MAVTVSQRPRAISRGPDPGLAETVSGWNSRAECTKGHVSVETRFSPLAIAFLLVGMSSSNAVRFVANWVLGSGVRLSSRWKEAFSLKSSENSVT